MSLAPLNVIAVSSDALRPELLDRLLDDHDSDVIVVESIARAYSRIRQLHPHIVVVYMEIDDVDACRLLSMLHADRALRGICVMVCTTTGPAGGGEHTNQEFEHVSEVRAAAPC
jgi:CheY-like chemotaxis protein